MARRRMNGSATFCISIAVCTRVDDAALLELALQREAVDDGGEHSHVIRGRAIHPAMTGGESAPDVAAADDDRDLHPEVVDLLHLARDFLHDLRRDRVAAAGFAERFTA